MRYDLECPQCGEAGQIIIRSNNIICLQCGYEETKEYHFARLLSDIAINQAQDGLDRSEYLLWAANAYNNASFLLDVE